jgi:polysaccharide export outer membrane protein
MINNKGLLLALTAVLSLSLGCGTGQKKVAAYPGETEAITRTMAQIAGEKTDYRISPQDLLAVSVYREADLKKEARVSAEGKISFPLAGEIRVGGLTTLEAEALIRDALKPRLVNPQVSVEVKEYRARRVFVLGEVAKPGSYDIPPDRSLTVVEAITLAGGFTKRASPNRTRVVRRSAAGGGVESMIIPVNSVTKGDKSKDMALQSDDVVNVPEKYF